MRFLLVVFATTRSSEGASAGSTDNLVSVSEQPFAGIRVVMVAGMYNAFAFAEKRHGIYIEGSYSYRATNGTFPSPSLHNGVVLSHGGMSCARVQPQMAGGLRCRL